MRTSRHLALVGAFGLLSAVTLGCKKKPTDTPSVPSDEPSTTATVARDTLPPKSELRPGKTPAYGFILPVDFQIRSTYDKHIVAAGPAKPEQLAAYISKSLHVTPPEPTGTPPSYWFRLAVHPGEPKRPLEITIRQDTVISGWSKIEIEDHTPPPEPPPDKRDPKSRMESIGMSPDGKMLSPYDR